jgi:hypothetical protein
MSDQNERAAYIAELEQLMVEFSHKLESRYDEFARKLESRYVEFARKLGSLYDAEIARLRQPVRDAPPLFRRNPPVEPDPAERDAPPRSSRARPLAAVPA